MNELLSLNGITKAYGANTVLDNVSFQIKPGRIVGLLGPNGSGKTTLIKIINSLCTPTSGEVLIQGNRPGIESKKIVSYLPDKLYFNDYMTVKELMEYYMDFYNDFNQDKCLTLLSNLQIDVNAKIKTLSKGTKEKVQLIMVMSREALLYVLDEPIGGVDPASRDYILNTIINNYNPEASIIISTHLISDIETILDDCIFLQNGRIVVYNSVEALRMDKNMSIDELFREVFRC
ncbi:MAG: ABC transporter ATP-binding protein [Lachnospiraceae bacterium]|nr:ABC transporter ATP-binding protein [Lachnospiraceae bacterium]